MGLLAATLVAGVALCLAPATAHAGTKTVPFLGNYKGDASMLIDNGAVTISSVSGKGSGNLVGASTLTGKGSASASAQCDPFEGSGAISGKSAKLDITVLKSSAQGCSSGESGPVTVTLSGSAQVTGGSGKAAGAHGTLAFKGTLDLKGTSGSQTGTFAVKLTGKLSI